MPTNAAKLRAIWVDLGEAIDEADVLEATPTLEQLTDAFDDWRDGVRFVQHVHGYHLDKLRDRLTALYQPVTPSDTSAERVTEAAEVEHVEPGDPVAAELWAMLAEERRKVAALEAESVALAELAARRLTACVDGVAKHGDLKAQIATLTKERDEARGEVADLRKSYSALFDAFESCDGVRDGLASQVATLTKERDEARDGAKLLESQNAMLSERNATTAEDAMYLTTTLTAQLSAAQQQAEAAEGRRMRMNDELLGIRPPDFAHGRTWTLKNAWHSGAAAACAVVAKAFPSPAAEAEAYKTAWAEVGLWAVQHCNDGDDDMFGAGIRHAIGQLRRVMSTALAAPPAAEPDVPRPPMEKTCSQCKSPMNALPTLWQCTGCGTLDTATGGAP
jgi:hypothetical protein